VCGADLADRARHGTPRRHRLRHRRGWPCPTERADDHGAPSVADRSHYPAAADDDVTETAAHHNVTEAATDGPFLGRSDGACAGRTVEPELTVVVTSCSALVGVGGDLDDERARTGHYRLGRGRHRGIVVDRGNRCEHGIGTELVASVARRGGASAVSRVGRGRHRSGACVR
jgi:hypothetical protein